MHLAEQEDHTAEALTMDFPLEHRHRQKDRAVAHPLDLVQAEALVAKSPFPLQFLCSPILKRPM